MRRCYLLGSVRVAPGAEAFVLRHSFGFLASGFVIPAADPNNHSLP
jgi:hypothetical protein